MIREGDGFDSKDDHEFMHDIMQYNIILCISQHAAKIPGYFREIGMF